MVRTVMMRCVVVRVRVWLCLGVLLVCPMSVWASDHADPLRIFSKSNPAESLAGLFVFPSQDKMTVILTLYPGLKSGAQPKGISRYEYRVNFSLHVPVDFADEQQRVRFGGTVSASSAIKADATMTFKLKENAELSAFEAGGALQGVNPIKTFAGVRDDPFIFPRFFGTNVVALVAELPRSAFGDQTDFIIWGGIYKNGKKIDHVGRSNRTMQPRLDFLNTLEPDAHLAAIIQRHDSPNVIQRKLMQMLQPLLAIRDYDKFVDVMIYSKSRPAGFPNGRKLTDDVAALTCQYGDCLLWELSYGDVKTWEWPRKTVNDKPFLQTFPYLAEPW
ncbi:MAG: hypothetical protein P8176_00350 [Gammaproteobacteria bacterium]